MNWHSEEARRMSTAELVAAWTGIAASALISLAAFVVSVKSLSAQKESARAATISAEAAQRANWLTEQRMLNEVSRSSQAEMNAGEPLPRTHQPDDEVVQWSLDRRAKNAFILRNVGTKTAEDVAIPPEAAASISRNLPESATLRPNESVEFMMLGSWGAPVPNEILVTWKDNPNGVLLPVPA